MLLTISEQIKIICKRKGVTLSALAKSTNQSRQNLYNKLNNNNFTVQDLELIAKVLECDLIVTLQDRTV